MAKASSINHALLLGHVICGFTDEPAEKWPDGHRIAEVSSIPNPDLTCPICQLFVYELAHEQETRLAQRA